ncbi:hypothetical protein LAG90_03100 [Marinilongibacter aquaticus]|uniref:hypothetical protein n=1 Tax=Marinilongibacter aquaticus TaxID=2975157 RepID=UPI0021BD36F3|nr:hypothetical protein [Marinilongibacter aquaticus]UBM59638.1 hypothetical protein LAG90_03100 [Marinilongibacter aquaticus]
MKKIKYSLTVVLFFLLLSQCKEKKEPEPSVGNSDEEMDFTEKTNFISDENALIEMDTTSQTYVLDAGAFDHKPEKGEIVVVSGQIMRKVVSVQEVSGNYSIQTEDATLPEVIENGTLEWEITPSWDDLGGVSIDGKTNPNFRMTKGDTIKQVISVAPMEYLVQIVPTASNGEITACTFEFVAVKKVGGRAAVTFSAKGTATLPKQHTRIVVENGKVKDFVSENDGIKADFEFKMAAAGGISGEEGLKLPAVALNFPIRYLPTPSGLVPNPIPMSIGVGVQFVSKMKIVDAQSSATATSKCSYTANAGFKYEGTDVESKGSLLSNSITDGTFDSAANLNFPIDVQFGVAFPRISFNIAGQEVAYVHSGFTAGSSLYWGPICKSGYAKLLVEGGYELKLLGVELAKGKKTFAELERVAKGENCQ